MSTPPLWVLEKLIKVRDSAVEDPITSIEELTTLVSYLLHQVDWKRTTLQERAD